MNKKLLLVMTPIEHINGLVEFLESHFSLLYRPFLNANGEVPDKEYVEAIFTNPNMSRVFLGKEFLQKFTKLKVIATASTGTTHIDVQYLQDFSIRLLSLTRDYDVINQITSTAEHALALTLQGLRNLCQANASVRTGKWEYLPFVGRQFQELSVGVIGYGRLGKLYSRYAGALGAKVTIFDPYESVESKTGFHRASSLDEVFSKNEVVALHVHVTPETMQFINHQILKYALPNLILVNTSRGEIINEADLITFLRANQDSKYMTDVLAHEQNGVATSAIFREAQRSNQIFITPHIGGMTHQAQSIAYHATGKKLVDFFASAS